jgi:hypothetical protein
VAKGDAKVDAPEISWAEIYTEKKFHKRLLDVELLRLPVGMKHVSFIKMS